MLSGSCSSNNRAAETGTRQSAKHADAHHGYATVAEGKEEANMGMLVYQSCEPSLQPHYVNSGTPAGHDLQSQPCLPHKWWSASNIAAGSKSSAAGHAALFSPASNEQCYCSCKCKCGRF